MSRTHLYRGASPAPRSFASLVLAGGWTGAALTALLATAPLDANAADAAALATVSSRLFLIVAIAGAAIGVALVLNELVAGRTRWRAARLGGALLLAGAGGIGSLDAVRGPAPSGGSIGGVPEAIAAEPGPAEPGEVARVAGERLIWTTLGLAGAALVLAGGLAGGSRPRGVV